MTRYKCIKEFDVDVYDDYESYVEGTKEVEVGSEWELNDDGFRIQGGEVLLTEVTDEDVCSKLGLSKDHFNMWSWLELPQEYLDEYFEEVTHEL